jgi:hypothetical protein
MRKLLFLNILLLLFSFVSCKTETKNESNTITFENSKDENSNKEGKSDEDFNTFLKKFNQDSIFQISRIKFPLKVNESDPDQDYETIERIIQLKDFTKLNFEYPKDALNKDYDRYTRNIKIEKDSAVIEIRGIENGIHSDIIFEKKNGKWKLKTWNDQST